MQFIPVPVVAIARSRLHADVMMIRLRRAEVPLSRISALFGRNALPNSVACWLRQEKRSTLRLESKSLLAAGPIRKWLKRGHREETSPAAVLRQARFDHPTAAHLEESLRQGNILLCVHAADEADVAIAWHVFKHASAEFIALPTVPLNSAPAKAPAVRERQPIFDDLAFGLPA